MSANPVSNEQDFSEAALRHWELLGEELRRDIDKFNKEKGGSVSLIETASTEYRVNNPDSGLEARIAADTRNHIVHYGFLRMNDTSAGAPEGGILSMRLGQNGVEFYSADRPLTASEARSLFLDPILNLPAA